MEENKEALTPQSLGAVNEPKEKVESLDVNPTVDPVSDTSTEEKLKEEQVIQPEALNIEPEVLDVKEENIKTDAPKKKSKAPLIIILLVVLLAGAGAAYYFFLMPKQPSGPKDIAKQYINNIMKKVFTQSYNMLNLPDNSFVTNDEFINYIQENENYMSIIGGTVDNVDEVSLTDTNATYKISVKAKDGSSKTVDVQLIKVNGTWKVVDNDFCIENWIALIPEGSALYINDVLVDESHIQSKTSFEQGNYDIGYLIPVIGTSTKTFTIENAIQKSTVEVTPTKENSNNPILVELTNEDILNKAYEYIKTTWNNMYKDYTNGVSDTEMGSKYFDSSVLPSFIEKYCKTDFDTISSNRTNLSIIEVVKGKENSRVRSKEIITVSFGYKLTWKSNDIDVNMTRYSSLTLKVEGDSFKIVEVPDESLFSLATGTTKEF